MHKMCTKRIKLSDSFRSQSISY